MYVDEIYTRNDVPHLRASNQDQGSTQNQDWKTGTEIKTGPNNVKLS